MISAIKKVIDDRVKIEIIKTANDHELVLKEDSDGSDIEELRIINIPEESFAFTLDYTSTNGSLKNIRLFRKLSCYVSSKNEDGINKSCDLVIVTRRDDGVKVIVLDLKSKRTSGKRPTIQIENSILFLNYIFSLIDFYYKEEMEISINDIKYIKALVTTGPTQKTTVSKRPSNSSDVKKVPVKATHKKATIRYSSIAA